MYKKIKDKIHKEREMNLRKTYKRQEQNIKWIILDYINKNAKIYLILLILFFIGIILGICFVNNTNEAQANQISSYINNFVNNLKSNYEISKVDILLQTIKNNFIIILILWFLGCTVIGMPLIYLIITYKGYCIGYTVAAVVASLGVGKGIVFIILTMLLQNIIYIPIILTTAVSGINLHKLITEDKRRENIKLQILKHSILSILMLIILTIEAFVEAYISGNLVILYSKIC